MQVVKGTHRCGRIEHKLVHGQTQADPERVEELLKQFTRLHAELQPGNTLTWPKGLIMAYGRGYLIV